VLVVDEYLAVRILVGDLPAEIDPDETFGLPAYNAAGSSNVSTPPAPVSSPDC